MARLTPGINDLYTQCKENHMEDVLESWDMEKNYPLTPSDVTFRSGKKVWWKCSICGMQWETKIATRTNGHGCPQCGRTQSQLAGLKTRVKNNNLKENWPDLVKEWNYERNTGMGPEDYSSSSRAKVWWKCKKGHEWEQTINSRTGQHTKCPVCNRSGRVVKGLNDFGTLFPQYAREWDYDRNEKTPNDYTSSSSEAVWWKCEKGHEWKQPIVSRTTTNAKCPVCSNRKLLKGYNDLASQHPELAKEWDFANNNETPSDVKINSNDKVNWICSKCGHHFSQRIIDRVYSHTGCPICGQKKAKKNFHRSLLSTRLSLADKHPELVSEWDYDKNHGLDPKDVLAGTKKAVWWKCKYGHTYYARILNRVKGSGCPRCNLKSTTSFPEQCVYFYVKKAFVDAQNGYRLNRKIYDVFVPSQKIAIEYDGYKWHQDERDTKNDEIKNHECIENGIRLFRIREEGCANIATEGITIIPCVYNDEQRLESAINTLLGLIGANESVSIERDRNEIQNQYFTHLDEQSLSFRFPEIAKEWNFEKNDPILPSMVHSGTKQQYWWKCKYGHEWRAQVANRTRNGTGCPFCKGTKVLKGHNDLQTVAPGIVKEWNYEKNAPLTPDQVSSRSNAVVWWKCSQCGFEWTTKIVNRIRGSECPSCSRKKLSVQNRKSVKCVETSIAYCSILEAAKWAGVSSSAIVSNLKGKTKSAGGYHWEYADV